MLDRSLEDKELAIDRARSYCKHCEAGNCCLRSHAQDGQFDDFVNTAQQRGPYSAGQHIQRIEERANSLFVISSGSVKTECISDDGTIHVGGFYFPGELIGLESIGARNYQYDAIALEPTWVCEIPLHKMELLCLSSPNLQHQLFSRLGARIRQFGSMSVQRRHMTSERRLLLFLKDLHNRQCVGEHSDARVIRLPMYKGDLASYLGICPESLSRALARLQKKGMIRNRKKYIEILDTADLDAVAPECRSSS